jgi:DNA-binding transcriptional regulator YiaG
MKKAATQPRPKKPVRESLHAAMDELVAVMDSCRPIAEHFTVRSVQVTPPTRYSARQVQQLRTQLGVSQAVFAQMVGVSKELVENWEQSRSSPRPSNARLLDEIQRNPQDFLKRVLGPAARSRAV